MSEKIKDKARKQVWISAGLHRRLKIISAMESRDIQFLLDGAVESMLKRRRK